MLLQQCQALSDLQRERAMSGWHKQLTAWKDNENDMVLLGNIIHLTGGHLLVRLVPVATHVPACRDG